jgi:AbrB family looped-hinge helix DNA binding protein
MTTTIVDEKGRIVVPKPLRKELRITEGSRVSLQLDKERLVVSRAIEPKEFIDEMEGFVREDSRLPLIDPISLKRIWEKS